MQPTLRQRLTSDLPAAIKAGDRVHVAVLRTTLAALANAEAVGIDDAQRPAGLLGDVARRELSEHDERSIVERELADLRTAHAEHVALGQTETAARLATQAGLLARYLAEAPSPLTPR